MIDSNFYFRRATQEDAPKILDLFHGVMGKPRTLEEWQWRYLRSPVKELLVMLAVDKSDNVIGHYALHPIWLTHDGDRVLGGQSIDTMVNKDFRRQGLFVAMAKRCYSLAQNHGVKLLYGFPNNHSYHGFTNELGWVNATELFHLDYVMDLENVLRSKIPQKTMRLLLRAPFFLWLKCNGIRKRIRGQSTSPVSIREISRFDESFDKLWLQCKTQFFTAVWKDSEYLQWRYFDIPSKKYRVLKATRAEETVGFVTITAGKEKGVHVGHIVDLCSLPPVERNLGALIESALSIFETEGVHMAQVMLTSDSPYKRTLKHLGFLNLSRSHPSAVVKDLGTPCQHDASVTSRGWHLTLGDTDFI